MRAVIGFTQASVRPVRVPALVVSARSDPYLADLSARELFGWLAPPEQLLLLLSNLHGTDMLAEDASPNVRHQLIAAIKVFVAAHT